MLLVACLAIGVVIVIAVGFSAWLRRGSARYQALCEQVRARVSFHLVVDSAMSAGQFTAVDPRVHLVLPERPRSPGSAGTVWHQVMRQPAVDSRLIDRVVVGVDNAGVRVLNLQFDQQGSAEFAQFTGRHIGERVAIVIDQQVVAAPVVQSRIVNGFCQIMGDPDFIDEILACVDGGGPGSGSGFAGRAGSGTMPGAASPTGD